MSKIFNNCPAIEKNHVHVWLAATEQSKAEFSRLTSYLSIDEMQRVEQFRFDKHRHRYIAAHGVLRDILGFYLHKSPADIQFSDTEKGKPFTKDNDVQFNLSHSHELIAVAITLNLPVGIDIEYSLKENKNKLGIAKRFFAEEEYRQLSALPSEQQDLAFFELWTRKEAFVKALGEGLSFPLNEFVVSVKPEPVYLKYIRNDSITARQWTLHELQLPDNYVGTIAVESQTPSFFQFNYHSKAQSA